MFIMVPRLSNYETNFATAEKRGNVSRISVNTPAAIVMFWNILPTSEETFGEGVDG